MKKSHNWAWIKQLTLILVAGVATMSSQLTTYAADDASTANAAFTVAPVLPKDNDKDASYFELKIKPGETRKLKLRVTNSSPHTGKFDVTPRVASTNTNGYLDYSIDNHYPALPAETKDLFKPAKAQVINIPAKTSKIVGVNFKAPTNTFKGVMLTGFTIENHNATKNITQGKHKPTGIVATTAYVLAFEFYNHKPEGIITPNVLFHSAEYKLAHALPQISLNIENKTPALVSRGKLTATLTNDATKVVMKFKRDPLLFAPQNKFYLNLDLNNKQLPAGQYTLTGNLSTRGDGYFPFSFPVKVTSSQVHDVKQHAANFEQKKPINWILVLVVVLLVFILAALGTIIRLLLKKQKHGTD